MIPAIFQPEVNALEFQVTALQSQLAAAQQRIALLTEAEFVAGDSLEALKTAIHKVSSLAPSAVSNLRAAVLNLFTGDDSDDNGNGNQPQPAPQPGSDGGVEVAIAVERLTGQYTEWASPWACPLASPLTSAFACSIIEDAPRATLEVESPVAEQKPYVELIPVSHSVAYQQKTSTGEIICCYLGGNNKSRLKDWGAWLCNTHTVGTGFELRAAERLTAFKYEIKIWGMSIEDVKRLAESDTTKSPASNYGDAPQRKLEPVAPAPKPLQLNDIGVGDTVRSTTVKHWEYKVLGITEDKFLDCERIGVTPKIRAGLHPASVELVTKAIAADLTEEEIAIANESIQPPASTPAALKYNPYPMGRRGAAANWEAYQAHKAEQRRTAQTAVIDVPQPAPVESRIVAGDWVELLATGERCQVEEVSSQGLYILTDDGTANVREDEVKLLLHIPDSWKPF